MPAKKLVDMQKPGFMLRRIYLLHLLHANRRWPSASAAGAVFKPKFPAVKLQGTSGQVQAETGTFFPE